MAKTQSFIFNGEPGNLGRFGWITKGTPLPLNPREAHDVAKDGRFRRSDKDLFPVKFEPAKAGPAETEEQSKARLKADMTREALFDELNRQYEINEQPDKK